MLKVKNLSYAYKKDYFLKNISFELSNYGICGLLGANGAGKTTLLEIISTIRGLDYQGTISIENLDQRKDFNHFKSKIGILFQDEILEDKLTVEETFDYFKTFYKDISDFYTNIELLDLFELKDHKNKLIQNLSGGLKQRVKIAVTCMNKPKYILLDEPTTGLDPKYRKEFWKTITKIVEENKILILLSSHDMGELERYCNDMIYIKKGIIQEKGKITDILKKKQVENLEEYYLMMEDE